MPSPEQLTEKYALGQRNFERADLRELRLCALSLKAVRLCWADFTSSQLDGACLDDCDLTGAMMWRARLQNASCRWVNFHQATMVRCEAVQANFTGANFHRADLRLASLRRANFAGADLRGAKLCYSDLRGADLTGADLSGADLTGADLIGARMDAVCWRAATLHHAQMDEALLKGNWLEEGRFKVEKVAPEVQSPPEESTKKVLQSAENLAAC